MNDTKDCNTDWTAASKSVKKRRCLGFVKKAESRHGSTTND